MKTMIVDVIEELYLKYPSNNIEYKFKKNHLELYLEFISLTYYLDASYRFIERFYCLKYDLNARPKCKLCDNVVKFINTKVGYRQYCSQKCLSNSEERILNIKQTKKTKYGDENYNNASKMKSTKITQYGFYFNNIEKTKEVWQQKYGVDHVFKLKTVQEKIKNTYERKYGNRDYRNTEKVKQTKLKNHGDSKYNNRPLSHQTKLLRYGDSKYNNIEKCRRTFLERYGVTCALMLNNSNGFSKVSQKLFWDIFNQLPDDLKPYCYFKELNREYGTYFKESSESFMYDFVCLKNKKVIEFNGDFWHMNPSLFESENYNKVTKKTAQEIWDFDHSKLEHIKDRGYDALVVWEKDYTADPDGVVSKCLNFLKFEEPVLQPDLGF